MPATVALTVGLIIGVGIFRVPGAVAVEAGSVGRIILVWIAGGVIALCGALSIAELGAMFPRAGGVYVFLREAYGPLVAFLSGWTALVVLPSSAGATALVFAEYLGTFVPLTVRGTQVAAAAMILVVAAAAYRSTRGASVLQGIAALAKVLALGGVVALAFALGGERPPTEAVAAAAGAPAWSRLGVALIAVLYAYSGWQTVALMVGEVRDPGRTFPRALLTGVAIVLFVYLAVNAAYLHVLPLDALARSPLVAADVLQRTIGPAGITAVAALVLVSAFGSLTASLLAFPRVFYAMAEDGLFFPRLASVHPRHRTPHGAVAFLAAAAVTFVNVRSFEQLAEAMVVGGWPFLTLAVLAVPVLRRRRPELPRPYRTLGYPLVPLVFLTASVMLVASLMVEHPRSTLVSFGFTLLGIPVYLGWRAAGQRRAIA
jgi:basic amino acid/polyamine antiporter, APA family